MRADVPQHFRQFSSSLISVIVPVFNEAPNIVNNLRLLIAEIEAYVPRFEMLIVSDGSTDDTNLRVAGFHDPHVRLVAMERNKGKGYAVRHRISRSSRRLHLPHRRRHGAAPERNPHLSWPDGTLRRRYRHRIQTPSTIAGLLSVVPEDVELVVSAGRPLSLRRRRDRYAGRSEAVSAQRHHGSARPTCASIVTGSIWSC